MNWWRFRHENISLYVLMVWIPLLQWARNVFAWFRLSYTMQTGEEQIFILALQLAAHFAYSGLFATTRILASKGWGITRARLLRVEWRTVIGTGIFFAASDAFQLGFGGGANIAYLTFLCLLYTYIWLNFRHQRFILGDYVRNLTTTNAAKEVLLVYQEKYAMMERLRRCTLTFGMVLILVNMIAYLFSNAVPSSAGIIAYESIVLVESCAIAYILRLRPVSVIDLTPQSEEDLKKAAAQNGTGADPPHPALGERIRNRLTGTPANRPTS